MDGLVQMLGQFGGLGTVALVAAGLFVVAPLLLPLLLVRTTLRWMIWPLRGVCLLVVLAVAGVGLLGTVWVETTLRWGLAAMGQSDAFRMSFDRASGNLFTGELTLDGVKLVQQDHEVSRYDLTCEQMVVDLHMQDLLSNRVHLERVQMVGVGGVMEQLSLPPKAAATTEMPDVQIDKLLMTDARLLYRDHTAANGLLEIPMTIDSLVTDNMQGQDAAYALLCRSKINGRLADQEFRVAYDNTAEGKYIHWTCDTLPLEIAGAYFGGPFELMKNGRVSAKVRSQTPVKDADQVLDLDWTLTLNGIDLQLPERDDRPMLSLLGEVAERLVSEQQINVPVKFDLPVDREVFRGEMMPLASSAWKQVGEKVTEKLAGRLKLPGGLAGSLNGLPLTKDGMKKAAGDLLEKQLGRASQAAEEQLGKARQKLDSEVNRARQQVEESVSRASKELLEPVSGMREKLDGGVSTATRQVDEGVGNVTRTVNREVEKVERKLRGKLDGLLNKATRRKPLAEPIDPK